MKSIMYSEKIIAPVFFKTLARVTGVKKKVKKERSRRKKTAVIGP